MPPGIKSFGALGDSFTEGMNDVDEQGRFRGWADLFAGRLGADSPDFEYANLAVRGKLFDAIVDEQVPEILRMRPDLVSLAGGGNDALRPGFQPHRIATRLHEAVRVLTASGAQVLLVTASNVSHRLPATGMISGRCNALNDIIRQVARRHDAILVDLWEDDTFHDDRLWSEDRLHMSRLGHQRVAAHACAALDVAPDPEWMLPLPNDDRTGWLTRRREDAAWVRRHLAPWVHRRLTGRSSGDTITAKRPQLSPIRTEGA